MVDNKSKSKKIYEISYLSIMYLMITSSFLGLTSFLMFQEVKHNAYISVFIGSLIGIIFLASFIKIKKMAKDKDIIDYNIEIFGKFFGTIINIILNLSVFFVGCIFFQNIIMFVNTNYLMETSIIYVKILLLCVVAFTSSKKIFTIMKTGNIILILNVLFFVISIIGIFPRFKLIRIFPILNCSLKELICSSLIYTVCGLFSMFLLTIIPNEKIRKDIKNNKKIIWTYIISNLVVLVIFITIVLTLGEKLVEVFKYPEYLTLQEYSLFSIIERVENTLSLQFVLNTFISITIMVYFIYVSVNKIIKKIYEKLNKEYKKNHEAAISYIICLAILCFTSIFFNSSVLFTEILKKYYFYIILFGIIIPMFITLIVGSIKNKYKSN